MSRAVRRGEGKRGVLTSFCGRCTRAGRRSPGADRPARAPAAALSARAQLVTSAPGARTLLPEGRAGRGGGRGAQRGLRRLEGEVETCAAKGGGGAMTLFHFGNCFALAYFPYFITYKCSGL